MKKNLKAKTTVGEFSRSTESDYSFVVVWNSPRAAAAKDKVEAGEWSKSGKSGQWAKDRGFGVTWHGSKQAAEKAAAGRWMWDDKATLVGIFPVVIE